MEFPVLFLGAMPSETPALYSLMNYAGLKLGTYYPMGGFGKVIDAMSKVAEKMVWYSITIPLLKKLRLRIIRLKKLLSMANNLRLMP